MTQLLGRHMALRTNAEHMLSHRTRGQRQNHLHQSPHELALQIRRSLHPKSIREARASHLQHSSSIPNGSLHVALPPDLRRYRHSRHRRDTQLFLQRSRRKFLSLIPIPSIT